MLKMACKTLNKCHTYHRYLELDSQTWSQLVPHAGLLLISAVWVTLVERFEKQTSYTILVFCNAELSLFTLHREAAGQKMSSSSTIMKQPLLIICALSVGTFCL